MKINHITSTRKEIFKTTQSVGRQLWKMIKSVREQNSYSHWATVLLSKKKSGDLNSYPLVATIVATLLIKLFKDVFPVLNTMQLKMVNLMV